MPFLVRPRGPLSPSAMLPLMRRMSDAVGPAVTTRLLLRRMLVPMRSSSLIRLAVSLVALIWASLVPLSKMSVPAPRFPMVNFESGAAPLSPTFNTPTMGMLPGTTIVCGPTRLLVTLAMTPAALGYDGFGGSGWLQFSGKSQLKVPSVPSQLYVCACAETADKPVAATAASKAVLDTFFTARSSHKNVLRAPLTSPAEARRNGRPIELITSFL